jgi:23S rRNA (guanosine2251-2'-O)-methyltransferase
MIRQLSIQELGRLSEQDFKVTKKLPLVLVLDNIRSMHNVGAAFRIADAFLVEKIYLCGITAQPPHRAIHKTALGAENTIEWEYTSDTASLLRQLKKAGYLITAVEQTNASIVLDQYRPVAEQPYCLVFGHELLGITATALSYCDLALSIPQHGTKHSLNVAVAMGIVVWEIAKSMLPWNNTVS